MDDYQYPSASGEGSHEVSVNLTCALFGHIYMLSKAITAPSTITNSHRSRFLSTTLLVPTKLSRSTSPASIWVRSIQPATK